MKAPFGAPTVEATDELFAASVSEMCTRQLAPIVSAAPADQPLGRDGLRASFAHIATSGYFGMRVAERDGGSGLPLVAGGLVTEALPTFLAVAAVAQEATTFRLANSGALALREKYLGSLVSGELVVGSCISEPDVGSDSNHVRTTATPDRRGYRLRGAKLWSTNAPVADLLLVLARDADSGKHVRLLVPTGQEGVDVRPVATTGLRQGHMGEVFFDVHVKRDHVLTDTADDTRTVLNASWGLNRASMGLASSALLGRALATAAAYSTTRHQFGRPIGSFQMVQQILADAMVARDATRLLAFRALTVLGRGQPAIAEASAAKVFGNEAAVTHIGKLQQIAGAYGITAELPYAQWLADAAMLLYPDGTPQVQRLLIGRNLLDISAFA